MVRKNKKVQGKKRQRQPRSLKTVQPNAAGLDLGSREHWIALFEILDSRGFEVHLVNARQISHVPGRKTDMIDCQWLQLLHACGLLRGSFRPGEDICRLRALIRERNTIVTQR